MTSTSTPKQVTLMELQIDGVYGPVATVNWLLETLKAEGNGDEALLKTGAVLLCSTPGGLYKAGLLTQRVPRVPQARPQAPSPDSLKCTENPHGTPDFGLRDLWLSASYRRRYKVQPGEETVVIFEGMKVTCMADTPDNPVGSWPEQLGLAGTAPAARL